MFSWRAPPKLYISRVLLSCNDNKNQRTRHAETKAAYHTAEGFKSLSLSFPFFILTKFLYPLTCHIITQMHETTCVPGSWTFFALVLPFPKQGGESDHICKRCQNCGGAPSCMVERSCCILDPKRRNATQLNV